MPELVIPKPAQEGVSLLVGLSEQQMSSLKRALEKSAPTLDLSQLIKQIAPEVGLPEEQVRKIVPVLTSLYSAKAELGLSPEDFGRKLFDAFSKTGNSALETPERAETFRKDIEALLSLDRSLGVTARAAAVMVEQPHVWQTSRILTDLRPVFSQGAGEPPTAFLLIHNLRITYREAGRTQEFFVALDDNDLRGLQAVIQRAVEKEASLRTLVSKTGIPCLRVELE